MTVLSYYFAQYEKRLGEMAHRAASRFGRKVKRVSDSAGASGRGEDLRVAT
jgi:hypothetical protein